MSNSTSSSGAATTSPTSSSSSSISSSTASSTPTSSSSSSSSIISTPSSTSSRSNVATSTTSLPTSTSTSRFTQTTTQSSTIQDTTIIHTVTRHGTTSVQTSTSSFPTSGSTTSTASSSSSVITHGTTNNGRNGGLSTGGIAAIAVVVPVAVIALLIGLGIVFWRRRKQKKEDEDMRRKEVEDYNYNPNGDPTLPAIGSDAGGAQMTEDHSSGYRGWGATAASRGMSTTMSGGHTQQLSESGNSYGHQADGLGGDPNGMGDRDTMGSDDLAALPAMAGGAAAGRHANLRRGPSNASSAYSAGDRSESEERPPMPIGQAYDYTPSNTYGYGQHGPYGDASYGGGGAAGAQQPTSNGMPVVRDLNARRDTRIQPGGSYQQGNSGIAQNF